MFAAVAAHTRPKLRHDVDPMALVTGREMRHNGDIAVGVPTDLRLSSVRDWVGCVLPGGAWH